MHSAISNDQNRHLFKFEMLRTISQWMDNGKVFDNSMYGNLHEDQFIISEIDASDDQNVIDMLDRIFVMYFYFKHNDNDNDNVER